MKFSSVKYRKLSSSSARLALVTRSHTLVKWTWFFRDTCVIPKTAYKLYVNLTQLCVIFVKKKPQKNVYVSHESLISRMYHQWWKFHPWNACKWYTVTKITVVLVSATLLNGKLLKGHAHIAQLKKFLTLNILFTRTKTHYLPFDNKMVLYLYKLDSPLSTKLPDRFG